MAGILSITPTAVTNIAPTNTAQTVAGAAGPTYLITNTGSSPAAVLNAAGVTFATGIIVLPGTSIYLGGTVLSVIGLGSQLNIASGS